MAAALPPGWLDELGELLAIPSVSADSARTADVTRASEWVAEKVRRCGGEAEVREDGRLVVGEIEGKPGAPTVLVYGHYDVQPPEPLELWESDPFVADPRGEWLYARGVADDKGQLWMQLKAIEELAANGALPVTFRIVCDGEEETGGDAINRFLAADDGPADACVVFDGWMKRRNSPEFVVATRGLVALDLEVRTGARDLHSGHYGGTALNAIHALTQALGALYSHDGRLPEPLRAGVSPPAADELDGWRELPPGSEELERVGATPLDERAAAEFYERAFVEPSLDVTGILGGKPGLRNTTLVSRASAGVTIRVAPGQDPAVLAAAAEELLRDCLPEGASLEIVSADLTPAAVLPRGHRGARSRPRRVRAGLRAPPADRPRRRHAPGRRRACRPRDSHGHGGARAPRQPHALAERADAARDVPPGCRRGARDLPRARHTVHVNSALAEIDRETLRGKLENGVELTLVDALGPISYAAAHLPGAINIPPERVDALAERRIPSLETLVVVYCANPGCESSVEVATRLVELGYRNVLHYSGGKEDWQAAGLPLEGGRVTQGR